MAKARTESSAQDISGLKSELAGLKREVAALKRQLASASKGSADPRVDKLIKAIKAQHPRWEKSLESAGL